jgi:ankyrin repeat protein
VIKSFVEVGADINTPNNKGETPVFVAAEDKRIDMVRLLVKLGADINIADNDNFTPVHIAAMQGRVVMISLLAEFGTNINIEATRGLGLSIVAAVGGYNAFFLAA